MLRVQVNDVSIAQQIYAIEDVEWRCRDVDVSSCCSAIYGELGGMGSRAR